MYIDHLEVKNFRIYEELSVDFDPRVNLIVGRNAQGKTNLIEAVYMTSMGRSFRTARDSDVIRFGQERAHVKATAAKSLIRTTVEVTVNRQSKKSILKDGSHVRKLSEMMENILIVVFSPEDLRIVKEEPEKRRRFIDRELAQIRPAYYASLADYKKALSQRNILLKEERPDPAILSVFDEQLIIAGADVMRMRREFLDQIAAYSGSIHASITNGAEALALKYVPNVSEGETKSDQQALLRDALSESLDTDLRLRTTSRGPHKDDMEFFVNGINARKYGSQGQQRTCALSLKLADLDFIRQETGEEGILILDDVMSELDQVRREYLVRTLSNNQLFITATDVDEGLLAAYPDARILRIEAGRVAG